MERKSIKHAYRSMACVTVVIVGLILFGIVPNTFGIGLAGTFLSVLWLWVTLSLKESADLSEDEARIAGLLTHRAVLGLGVLWTLIRLASNIFKAHARFVSPGYDLSWFAQTITNVLEGRGLLTTSERAIDHLAQHWEPILYTASPFALFLSGPVSIVLWQSLAYTFGAIGAWFFAREVLGKTMQATCAFVLYLVGWAVFNPLAFDAHPPVFGALLFFPWIFWALWRKKDALALFLLILLSTCGEIFFAVVPAYIGYFLTKNASFDRKRSALLRYGFAFGLYALGYLLIGFYQRYFGQWLTGDAFPFAERYTKIGGDGMGILQTFLTSPLLVLGQFFSPLKLVTFAKALLYFGPLPYFALFYKPARNLAFWMILGIFPYFIKVGLSEQPNMLHTGTHYAAEFGVAWWGLAVFGLAFFAAARATPSTSRAINLFQNIFGRPVLLAPAICAIVLLNMSEWRRSPFFYFRQAFSAEEMVADDVRQFLATLSPSHGVMITGKEWLCPLAADRREWLLCDGVPERVLPKMDLSVVISSPEALTDLLKETKAPLTSHPNYQIVQALADRQPERIGWQLVFQKIQKQRRGPEMSYFVWTKKELVPTSVTK